MCVAGSCDKIKRFIGIGPFGDLDGFFEWLSTNNVREGMNMSRASPKNVRCVEEALFCSLVFE